MHSFRDFTDGYFQGVYCIAAIAVVEAQLHSRSHGKCLPVTHSLTYSPICFFRLPRTTRIEDRVHGDPGVLCTRAEIDPVGWAVTPGFARQCALRGAFLRRDATWEVWLTKIIARETPDECASRPSSRSNELLPG